MGDVNICQHFLILLTDRPARHVQMFSSRLYHFSFAELAAAVSNAGGLGQIGCACFSTPQERQADIQKAKRLTDKPFAPTTRSKPRGARSATDRRSSSFDH
jgi:NAD(P)H-dependent flavin oxidoreductase YrpB (nitropropane dioxygenase family)